MNTVTASCLSLVYCSKKWTLFDQSLTRIAELSLSGINWSYPQKKQGSSHGAGLIKSEKLYLSYFILHTLTDSL